MGRADRRARKRYRPQPQMSSFSLLLYAYIASRPHLTTEEIGANLRLGSLLYEKVFASACIRCCALAPPPLPLVTKRLPCSYCRVVGGMCLLQQRNT